MRCLCHASTQCNATVGCSQGYCGPYYLNRNYWKDAGQPVLHDDDPERDQAFVDCAVDAACALRAVESYMAKWGRVSVLSYLAPPLPPPTLEPAASRHTRHVDGGISAQHAARSWKQC